MKCLNCDDEATLKVVNDSSDDQFYCENDLPGFLRGRGFQDRVSPLAVEAKSEPAPVVEEPVVQKTPKKKKEETVAELVVTEEPAVELIPEEK